MAREIASTVESMLSADLFPPAEVYLCPVVEVITEVANPIASEIAPALIQQVPAVLPQETIAEVVKAAVAEVSTVMQETFQSMAVPAAPEVIDVKRSLIWPTMEISFPSLWKGCVGGLQTGFAYAAKPRNRLVIMLGGYGLWLAYKHGWLTKPANMVTTFVPFGDKILDWWERRKTSKIMGPAAITHTLESRRSGSEEVSMTRPPSQVTICYQDNGAYVYIGSAVRFSDNALVGPDHVLAVTPGKPKYASGSQGVVCLDGKERILLDTDLVFIQLDDREVAAIGAKVAKIQPLPVLGKSVQVCSPASVGTVGKLTHDTSSFGRVIYSGTTVNGYSGGIYCAGTSGLGIHHYGGPVNGGYNAQYISLLINEYHQRWPEDSEKWLTSQFEAGNEIEWQPSGDPGYVRAKISGEYHSVTVDAMISAFGSDYHNHGKLKKSKGKKNRGSYDDDFSFDYESGECQTSLGGSSNVDGPSDPELSDSQALLRLISQLSKKQLKQASSLLRQLKEPISSMNGQERIVSSPRLTA